MKTRNLVALAWLTLASPAVASQGSGCLPTTGTVSGLSMTQYINQALAALISGNSGASAPSTDCSAAPVKGQFWVNTSITPNLLQQYDGNSWIVLGAIDSTNHLWSPPVGGGVASVTAAPMTDICAAPAAVQNITGTTTITSFGTGCVVGLRKTLLFNSATPLTYNAASLILPGQASYTATPGDVADAVYLGAGNWRIISITKIDGSAVTNPATPVGTVLYGHWGTIPAKTVYGAGYALPRASYPEYFAAVTRVQTGSLTAGNNTITGVANTAGLGAGMPLEGNGVQSGTTIVSVTSSTIVMSATATANGSQSVRTFITGYGSGGDSTTVGVIDCRGRGMAGRPDMGGGDTGRLAAANFGTSALRLNATGGADSRPVATGNLPAQSYSLAGTPATIVVDSTRSDLGLYPSGQSALLQKGEGTIAYYVGNPPSFVGGLQSTGNYTPGGTIGPLGSGVALPTVQPTAIAECVVAVLP